MTSARASIVVGLLIMSTVSWRHGAYYEGGFDSVVIAKALLGCLALVLATMQRSRCFEAGVGPYAFLAIYVTMSLLGAAHAGVFFPSFVLAARVVLIAVTIQIVWSSIGTYALINEIGRAHV